ncbi:MAG TPA: redoxin domain-containing protein [Candidatus Binatia bacterium]|jgi:methylamine dehydrogenase accessory protein MauD
MIAALSVSVVLLWVVVVVLCGVVFALTRQIGVLYERVAPAGALMIGRGVVAGDEAPVVRAPTLAGNDEMVGAASEDGRSTLVFFLSPTCPVCKSLLPALRSMAAAEAANLRVLVAGDGSPSEHEAFAREQKLDASSYLLSTQLGVTWQIAKLPYAVLVDDSGIVRAHGLVNSREHLESLLEARDRGVASIQELVRRQGTARDAAAAPGRAKVA